MMLDTNALSAWADGTKGIEQPLRSATRLMVPSVVLGEFYFGIRQSRHRQRYTDWLAGNLPLVECATIGLETASAYADIRLSLKAAGTPIPVNDTWIAALARQHQLPVLSRDTHFDAVENLERISW
jgi:tRNA(fMet)-specific endonuclease VapC